MITLNNLTYSYKKGDDVIKGITTDIPAGMHLLLGENGAGKTTLLHLIAGLLYPTQGTCRYNDVDMRLRLPSILSQVQYFTPITCYPAPTIAAMEKCHAPFFPNFDREMLASNLDAFGISPTERLNDMSLGASVKAGLAYMLSLRCQVLLLDEPTIGLDITSKQLFNRMLLNCISPDQTVIFSTHNIGDSEPLFDNLLIINRGNLLLNIPIPEITDHLAFVNSTVPEPDALYSELFMGRNQCIIKNPAAEIESQPDITLLYNALGSPSRQAILNSLNSSNHDTI